jgi:hypothetical protein
LGPPTHWLPVFVPLVGAGGVVAVGAAVGAGAVVGAGAGAALPDEAQLVTLKRAGTMLGGQTTSLV